MLREYRLLATSSREESSLEVAPNLLIFAKQQPRRARRNFLTTWDPSLSPFLYLIQEIKFTHLIPHFPSIGCQRGTVVFPKYYLISAQEQCVTRRGRECPAMTDNRPEDRFLTDLSRSGCREWRRITELQLLSVRMTLSAALRGYLVNGFFLLKLVSTDSLTIQFSLYYCTLPPWPPCPSCHLSQTQHALLYWLSSRDRDKRFAYLLCASVIQVMASNINVLLLNNH